MAASVESIETTIYLKINQSKRQKFWDLKKDVFLSDSKCVFNKMIYIWFTKWIHKEAEKW